MNKRLERVEEEEEEETQRKRRAYGGCETGGTV